MSRTSRLFAAPWPRPCPRAISQTLGSNLSNFGEWPRQPATRRCVQRDEANQSIAAGGLLSSRLARGCHGEQPLLDEGRRLPQMRGLLPGVGDAEQIAIGPRARRKFQAKRE